MHLLDDISVPLQYVDWLPGNKIKNSNQARLVSNDDLTSRRLANADLTNALFRLNLRNLLGIFLTLWVTIKNVDSAIQLTRDYRRVGTC